MGLLVGQSSGNFGSSASAVLWFFKSMTDRNFDEFVVNKAFVFTSLFVGKFSDFFSFRIFFFRFFFENFKSE